MPPLSASNNFNGGGRGLTRCCRCRGIQSHTGVIHHDFDANQSADVTFDATSGATSGATGGVDADSNVDGSYDITGARDAGSGSESFDIHAAIIPGD